MSERTYAERSRIANELVLGTGIDPQSVTVSKGSTAMTIPLEDFASLRAVLQRLTDPSVRVQAYAHPTSPNGMIVSVSGNYKDIWTSAQTYTSSEDALRIIAEHGEPDGALVDALVGDEPQVPYFVATDAAEDTVLWRGQRGADDVTALVSQRELDHHDSALWPALLRGLGLDEAGA